MTEYLLIDGYNVINAWTELKGLARGNLEHARIPKFSPIRPAEPNFSLTGFFYFEYNEVI